MPSFGGGPLLQPRLPWAPGRRRLMRADPSSPHAPARDLQGTFTAWH